VGYASIIKESFATKLGHQPFEGDLLIVDEAHYLANNKSKRSIAVRQIARQFQYVLMLTGTPMLAHPIELFPLLNLASPSAYHSYWGFATKFAGARKTKFGWDVKGASNLPELTKILSGVMHRVRKSEADLPPKRRALVPIDLENDDRRDMEDAVAGALANVSVPKPGIPGAGLHNGGVSPVTVSGEIRQIVYDARRDETLEWITDWAKGSPDKKLLVFAWNKAVVADLVMGLTGALDLPAGTIEGVTGDLPIAQRDVIVKRFNEDPKLRFLVATIASAGTAYDMHKQCADGVFVQCDWTPGAMIQAEDRLGRAPGGEAVTWHYLAAAGTIDERIIKVLHKKQETFNAVVDGGAAPTVHFEDVLQEILKWKVAHDARRSGRRTRETVA
jgi:SNF2 family DNA or RNA helicase